MCAVKEMRRQLSVNSRSAKSVHLSQFQSERTTGALPWPCPDTNIQPVPSLDNKTELGIILSSLSNK